MPGRTNLTVQSVFLPTFEPRHLSDASQTHYLNYIPQSSEIKFQSKYELYIHVTAHRDRLLFNNQKDALIIQIYSVIKLYMFRAFSLPIIRSFLLPNTSTHGVLSWLCLEAVIKNLHETYQCRMYSRKLLMMGREDTRNM